MNRTKINDAVQIIVEYLLENGQTTAEKLQDEISSKIEIEAGTMNELYEAALDLLEDEILVDFTGITLKD